MRPRADRLSRTASGAPQAVLGLAAALWLILTAAAIAADTLHVIELRHRPAAEIEPVVRPLLRPDEALSGTGYRLILRASEARRAEIELLVATLDVAARQLTLTLRQTAVRSAEQRRDSVSGDVTIGTRGRMTLPSDRSSNADALTVERDGLRYRAQRRTANTDETHTQTLRLQEGKPAFVRVGQSVPAVERVLILTGRGSVLAAQGVDVRQLATGFDVVARVRGERVQLDITPRLSAGRDSDGTLRFQELQTSVTAKLGEWIDLGGTLGQSSEVNRAILAGAASGANEEVRIALKVE